METMHTHADNLRSRLPAKGLIRLAIATCASAMLTLSTGAWGQQTVRLAAIEPLSGPFQSQGDTNLRTLQAAADEFNARSKDLKFEVVAFDAKGKAEEAMNIFRKATERGIRYFVGGGSSAIVSGLIETVNRYNERNPEREVLYLNHQAIDPAFTESQCSFWHFRFDPHVRMRMFGLASHITGDKSVKKVYLINQDYSFGQQVEASAKSYLGTMRPDIVIAGEERHPIGSVKDFSPYVAKIKASGADTVITGNFGQDLVLLIKAAKDIGLGVKFYTFYGNALGAPTTVGAAGVGSLRLVTTWETNALSPRGKTIYDSFKTKYPKNDIFHTGVIEMVNMLGEAANRAASIEPKSVAFALEGLKIQGAFGEVQMRATDHQLLAPMFIQTFEPLDGKKVKYGVEGLPYGFRTDSMIPASATEPIMACQMKRPAR
jgi:branched-chain amino acid transport system substrate-binding protein